MHPLKLFPSCCRLCCALDAPLPASIVAFTGGNKTDSLWGEVGMFGSDIYIHYNNFVYIYIHLDILYYNTICTHTFPIIIHLILLDSFSFNFRFRSPCHCNQWIRLWNLQSRVARGIPCLVRQKSNTGFELWLGDASCGGGISSWMCCIDQKKSYR